MGVGGSDNWLFECLDEIDVETLKGSVGLLNEALKKCKDAFLLEMDDKTVGAKKSVFRQNMVDRIAKSLRHLHKKEKKTYKDHKELLITRLGKTWMEVRNKVTFLLDELLEVIKDNFFPIELDSWDNLVEDIVRGFWRELFKEEIPIPRRFLKAIHRVNKDLILWCIDFISSEMDGVDLFDLNREGDNLMISAIKSCSEPIKKLRAEKDDMETKKKTRAKRASSLKLRAISIFTKEKLSDDTSSASSSKELKDQWEEAENWQKWIKILIHLLAQAGAIEDPKNDSDAIDQFGWTALMWAVVKKETEIVETLCSTTADIDYIDPCGRTPLHLAVQKGNAEIVKCLVSHGAEVHCKNAFGETPLSITQKLDQKEIFLLLGGIDALEKEKNSNFKNMGSNCPAACC